MARIKVRITAETVYTLDTEAYQSEWQEHCDDEGDMEEGDDYAPVPKEFALEQFQEALEHGDEDLAMVMESALIDVKEV